MAGSETVSTPAAAVMLSGIGVANSGTLTSPFTPAAPWWMWPSVGALMPFQEKANVMRSPCTRISPVALPFGSPTGGLPGTWTSWRPSSFADRNTGFRRDRWMPADRSCLGAGAVAGIAPWSMFIPDMSMPGMLFIPGAGDGVELAE